MTPRQTLLAGFLALLSPVSASAASELTVAVAYFDNNTGQAEYDPLRKGLADMLITDLTNVPSVTVVEREKLNLVLAELKLSQGRFVDPALALKLGKGLAAHYILTGGYVVSGTEMRVDARLMRVGTGAVVMAERVEGQRDDFFSLEKDLMDALVRALQVKLGGDARAKLRRNQTQSFDAWRRYSEGLDAQDQGDEEAARAKFQAALDADPGYRAASTQLERTHALMALAGAGQAKRLDAAVARLDPKSKTFGCDSSQLMATLGFDEASVRQRIAVLTLIAERELRPSCGEGLTKYYVEALHLPAVAMGYYWDPDTIELVPPVYEYVLRKYPDDRTITTSNLRDDPGLLQQQIERMRADPSYRDFMRTASTHNKLVPAYNANRAAAQRLFRLVTSKLPRAPR